MRDPRRPQRCTIDEGGTVWDWRTYGDWDGETPAVAIPTDPAAWPDAVRERVVEAASQSLAHCAGVDGSTRRRRLVTAGAVDYYRDAARAAVTAALSALADATREAP